MKKVISGRIIRIIDDSDEKGKRTHIAIGNRAGEPPHVGAVALGPGLPTISNVFAAFEMPAEDAAASTPGKNVVVTIED